MSPQEVAELIMARVHPFRWAWDGQDLRSPFVTLGEHVLCLVLRENSFGLWVEIEPMETVFRCLPWGRWHTFYLDRRKQEEQEQDVRRRIRARGLLTQYRLPVDDRF